MTVDLTSEYDPANVPDDWYLERMRAYRDRLLASCDWTQAADDPTGNAAAWATYRQQLRDFPATWTPGPTADFPDPPA
jgi:hypothetical protein